MIRRFQSLVFSCPTIAFGMFFCFTLGCGSGTKDTKDYRTDGMAETVVVADHSTNKPPPPPGSKDARYQIAADEFQDTTRDEVQFGATVDTLGALAIEEPVDGINYYAATLYLDGLSTLKRYEEVCGNSGVLHKKLCVERVPIAADACETFQTIFEYCEKEMKGRPGQLMSPDQN